MEEKIVKPISNPVVSPATPAPTTTADPQPESEAKVEQVKSLTDVDNETKDVTDSLIPTEDYRISPLWHEVVNYLNIPQEEWDGAKNEVSAIVDYVIQEIKSNDPDKILMKLRELEDRIERPGWDEKRYKVLYRYVRLAGKKQSIEQAMKAFEKKGVTNGN